MELYFSSLIFFSQLSRPGHTDLLPPQAPSAGTSGAGRKGGWGGRIRISAVTSRQRRTDGEITFKHTRLRIFVHDPPSRQPLFSAATHIRAPFGAQVALRIAVPPCFVSGLACTSSSPALVDLPPHSPPQASVCRLSIKPSSIPANAAHSARPPPRRDRAKYIPSAALIEFPSRSPIILRNQKPSAW